jgi:hypothetical protein
MTSPFSIRRQSIHRWALVYFFYLFFVCIFLISNQASAEDQTFRLDDGHKYFIGFGTAIVEFDTTFRIEDKKSQLSLFIDGEGTLGLPDVSNVSTVFGGVRLGEKHSLRASFFSVKRESRFEVSDLNLEDLIIVDAELSLTDSTNFLNLDYGYNLFRDDRSSVDLLLGLFVLDLNYVFEANGQVEINGFVEGGQYIQDASVIAPVPNIGLNLDFAFTPKWSVGANVSFIQGQYQEISASAFRTGLRAKYQFSRHFAGQIGLSYFDARVTIDEDDTKMNIGYGYDGLYAGLMWGF